MSQASVQLGAQLMMHHHHPHHHHHGDAGHARDPAGCALDGAQRHQQLLGSCGAGKLPWTDVHASNHHHHQHHHPGCDKFPTLELLGDGAPAKRPSQLQDWPQQQGLQLRPLHADDARSLHDWDAVQRLQLLRSQQPSAPAAHDGPWLQPPQQQPVAGAAQQYSSFCAPDGRCTLMGLSAAQDQHSAQASRMGGGLCPSPAPVQPPPKPSPFAAQGLAAALAELAPAHLKVPSAYAASCLSTQSTGGGTGQGWAGASAASASQLSLPTGSLPPAGASFSSAMAGAAPCPSAASAHRHERAFPGLEGAHLCCPQGHVPVTFRNVEAVYDVGSQRILYKGGSFSCNQWCEMVSGGKSGQNWKRSVRVKGAGDTLLVKVLPKGSVRVNRRQRISTLTTHCDP